MKFVEEKKEFDFNIQTIDKIIYRKKSFPEMVFKKDWGYFLFLTFDELYSPNIFLRKLKGFLKASHEDSFKFSVVSPDPEKYFFKHFKKYSILSFDLNDTEEDYLEILNRDPGDSPADSIITNSNSILINSDNADWAVYGERELGVAICSFKKEEFKDFFKIAYGNSLLNIDEVLKIMGNAYKDQLLPKDIEKEMRTNFSLEGISKNSPI